MVLRVHIIASSIRALVQILLIVIQHTVTYCADYIIMLTLTLLHKQIPGTVTQQHHTAAGTQQTVQHMYQLHVVAKI